MSKRRRRSIPFALCGVLALLGLFVVHGSAGGVILLATMLAFIGACIYALRAEDPDAIARNERSGLTGWIGGWF